MRGIWMVVLLLAILVSPVFADGGAKGEVEVGLFAGYALLDDYGVGWRAYEPDNDFLWGARVGYFMTPLWSLELSGQALRSDANVLPFLGRPGVDVDFDVESVRLNLLANFREGERFRPFITFGAGQESTEAGSLLDTNDLGINAGGGARWYLTQRFGVRLDGKIVSVDVGGPVDDRQYNFEGTVGALFTFGGKSAKDSDGDGIGDRDDDCPDTPRGALVDSRGCPRDSDGDGVFDGIDNCPDTPRGAEVDAKGCPKDSDGDGVFDGADRCPDTPRGAEVDAKGCPKDSDGDGVFDGVDKCPDTPRGAEVNAKGCPKDSDGDGVFDGIDKCPGTPKGTKVDSKGCKVLFEGEARKLVLEGVNFEFNSARLTPNATAILDRVAGSLRQWPEIRVEIGGHTDSAGRDAYNLDLSKRRAEAVRAYLASKGVDNSRMTAKGYGESKPIADNGTEEGRAKNRRVVMLKLN